MVDREELIRRGKQYCQTHRLVLGQPLGSGVHGIVFVVERQAEFGSTAMKVLERESSYFRERNVYLRLGKLDIDEIRGWKIPRLIEYDDDLSLKCLGIHLVDVSPNNIAIRE